jgi:hypothetical protein
MNFIEVKSVMGLTYLLNPIWIKEVLMNKDECWDVIFYNGDAMTISHESKNVIRNLVNGGKE